MSVLSAMLVTAWCDTLQAQQISLPQSLNSLTQGRTSTSGTTSASTSTGSSSTRSSSSSGSGSSASTGTGSLSTGAGTGTGGIGQLGTGLFESTPFGSMEYTGSTAGAPRTTTGPTTSRFNTSRFGSTGRGFNQGFNQSQTSRTIRPSLRLGFEAPPRNMQEIGLAAEQRVMRLSERVTQLKTQGPALKGMKIDVTPQGEVTLRGEVASLQASKLAANLLRMEPGVRSVRNELTVTEQ
jgi:osmotically-inducible protein OsmY